MSQPPGGINAPNNTGIFTNNQSGGTNIVNHAPPPWALTAEARNALISTVKAEKDISAFSILYAPLDANAQSFAYQLRQALIDGGLTEREFVRPLGIDLTGATTVPSGNVFYVRSTSAFAGVKQIMTSLKDSVPVIRHVQGDQSLPDDKTILIVVGRNDLPSNAPDLAR
jgi:hypothetical protein